MSELLHNTSYLCIKEINLLLRDYVMKYGKSEICYTNFSQDLYEVRFNLAFSRIMDINIKKLRADFFTNNGFEVDENGWMTISDLRTIISNAKELTLAPCEINLILGLSEYNDEGKVNVAHFNEMFRKIIPRMFSIDARKRKAHLVQLGSFRMA